MTSPNQIKKLDILHGKTSSYLVCDFTGEGHFGTIAKCMDLKTNEIVAIKIHKRSKHKAVVQEVAMLHAIRALDPEKKRLVKFIDNFIFNDISCLAFEMLDRSLWDLMKERKKKPLALNEIRPVACQLLVAFEALKDIGVAHVDLKADNVMLVNHEDHPFKVKLIDFGLALPISRLKVGMNLQAALCKAPEVTLGLLITESIDMWALGCLIAFLYFGTNLFSGRCAYLRMKTLCRLLGQPGDHLLKEALHTKLYFTLVEDSAESGWRLHTPNQYLEATGIAPMTSERPLDSAQSLEEAVKSLQENADILTCLDTAEYLGLLKGLLSVDARCRVTPKQALRHNFITMAHMAGRPSPDPYTGAARDLMVVASVDDHADPRDEVSDNQRRLLAENSRGQVGDRDEDTCTAVT